MTFKVLILGGTSEGRLLGQALAEDARYEALLSFAGRTANLVKPGTPHRVGGLGGIQGLTSFLRTHGFHALIDATHAFAAQMSRHAVAAAEHSKIPLLRVECPAWRETQGDLWTHVPDMQAAALALGERPKRVFLSVGRLEVDAFREAPQHDYLVRAVDPFDPGLPHARVLAARGPFAREGELRLLREERIDVLVSKNAGTAATYAKLEAARELGLTVIMVARPELPPAHTVSTVSEALAWLEQQHHNLPIERGV
jgi:precorrin-6A/cobalt-precorrin-6A reductase